MKKLVTIAIVMFLLLIMVGVSAFATEPEEISEQTGMDSVAGATDFASETEEISVQSGIEEISVQSGIEEIAFESEIDSVETPLEDYEEAPAEETVEEKKDTDEKIIDGEGKEEFLEEEQEKESSEDLVDDTSEDTPDETINEEPEAEDTDKGESAEESEIEEPEENSTEEPGEKEPVSEILNELDNETPHTINFTFNDQTRCIPIGTIKKELSQIISDIGIEGEIIDVTVYNDENCENPSDKNTVKSGETELFKAYEKDGAWYLDSLNPFTATYGLFVTTTEGKYKVNVSDPDAVYYLNPVYNDATDTSPGTAASGIKGWQTLSCSDYVVVGQSTNTWGTAGSDTWYVVNTNITLSDVEVRGNVHLILLDGTSLSSEGSTSQHAGIFVINTSEIYSSLTIYAGNTSSTIAGTGSLSAMGNVGAAGIGGSFSCSGKNITINGGRIVAESKTDTLNYGAAGIGGGDSVYRDAGTGTGENIVINGGSVTAKGYYGAAIGGGKFGTGSGIVINGGTVQALRRAISACIGGGYLADGFNIIINGGNITAKDDTSAIQNSSGAGIGGGGSANGYDIHINGGTVVASTGKGAGMAIGSGCPEFCTPYNITAKENVIVQAGETVIAHTDNTDLTTIAAFFNGQVNTKSASLIALTASGTVVTTVKSYDGKTTVGIEKKGTLTRVDGGTQADINFGVSAAYDNKNAGDGKIIKVTYYLGSEWKGIYQAPADYIITTGEISQITLSVTGTTADKVYDGNVSAEVTVGEVTGIIAGDDVTVSGSGTFSSKDVCEENIAITYSLSGDDSINYVAPSGDNVNARITQKQLKVTEGTTTADKVYDGNVSAEVTVGEVTGKIAGDDVTVSGSGTFSSKDVHEESIAITYSLSGNDSKNYVAPSGESVTAKITPKHLGVNGTTVESTRVYDGTKDVSVITAGTLNTTDIIEGDEVSLDAVSATVADKNIGSKKVTVAYTLEGKDKNNYTVADDTSKSITITARQLTVTGTEVESTKTYDGTKDVSVITGGTLDTAGIIKGEDVRLSTVKATVADKNIGTKMVTVAYTLTGADAGNYAVADDTSKSITITARQLTVTGTEVQDKVYDRTTTAQVIIGVVDFISGDNVSITATGTFDNEKPGENKDVTVVYSLKGADAGNYIKPSTETLKATIKGASGNLTADEFSRLFTAEGENGNVKLTGDIQIIDNSIVSLPKGTHDLYLNGFNLYLNNSYIEIGDSSETTLNIYGGADRQTDGNGVISTNSQYDIKVLEKGELNIYSGTITSGKSGAIYAGPRFSFTSENSGLVNVFGGTILSGNGQFCIYADGFSTVNIVGGTFTGKLSKYRFGTIAVAGGTFIGVHPGEYLLKDDGRYCVEVRKETAPTECYVVYPVNWYNCVRILSSGSSRGKMTGHISLSDAFNTDYATVVMLADSTADVTVNAYTIILDLNGFILKSRSTASVLSVNDCRLTIKDTGRTRVHYFKVESSGLWTLLTSEPTTKTINYEDLSGVPETGTIIAVKGGCITGASGFGIKFTTSGNPQNLIVENGNFIGNSGGGIYVNDCPVEMTGGIISGNIASSGAGIYIDGNNAAKIKGGSISYNTINQDNNSACGGGIYCRGDSLQITNTSVSYNKATIGGGIYVANGCVVDIEEGALIKGNTATEIGGGVYVEKGKLVITGGMISDNTATKGGGIYLASNSDNSSAADITMNNGRINANHATYGGGVYVEKGQFVITGGIISDNTATTGGGIFFTNQSSVIVGGTANILGNINGLRLASNLYLGTDQTVLIDSSNPLKAGALIGITVQNPPTDSEAKRLVANGAYANNFFSDNIKYSIKEIDGNVYLIVNNISWTYEVTASNEITATSDNGTTVKIWIKGLSEVYNQAEHAATVEGDTASEAFRGLYTVRYKHDHDKESSPNAPRCAGSYVAVLTLSVKEEKEYQIQSDISISKKQLTVTGTTVNDKPYDGTRNAVANVGKDNRITGDILTITATALFQDAEIGDNKPVHVTYAISGEDSGNYLVPEPMDCTASITKASPDPLTPDTKTEPFVIVTIVDLDSLSDALQTAVEKFLKEKNLSLVNIIRVSAYEYTGNTVTFTVPSFVFTGYDVNQLKIWKLEDGNTLVEVPYEVIDGVPVVSEGKLGLYVVTA